MTRPTVLALLAAARLASAAPPQEAGGPPAHGKLPARPFFGDTHLHTAVSFDAGAAGLRLLPGDAFRFARGEEVATASGRPVRLARPLDFLVVADHSEKLGLFADLAAGKPELLADPQGRRWHRLLGGGRIAQARGEILAELAHGTLARALTYTPDNPAFRSAWQAQIAAADEHDQPGRFTAFIAYEWSASPGGSNLHRNVVFRDGGDRAGQVLPLTSEAGLGGSSDPRDLWDWMAAYERRTGGRVLAIPHNGNLSNGGMFPLVESGGRTLDEAYALERARWERLYEVTQRKGDGETHPLLSPNDELAAFERWDRWNLDGSVANTEEMLPYEYARSALRNGLLLEERLGTNPYKFGLVGGSDAHTGLAGLEERDFRGEPASAPDGSPRLTRALHDDRRTGAKVMEWEVAAAGYAAVWAAENTRAALWDALERKETYATTGTRLTVRFFGGWDFEAGDAGSRELAAVGYAKGVPMGGDLRHAPGGRAPAFLVAALKDPVGGNLDRIQIVKGWLNGDGTTGEKVYDVAWSGARRPGPDGKLPPVGSTVDVRTATWTNTIGAAQLVRVWRDPDFDPNRPAFYYARVIEIPTPRWTAYDAARTGVRPLPSTRLTVTERAYTSPIWYTP